MSSKNHLFLLTLYFFLIFSCEKRSEISIETYTVEKSDFIFTVTETGELEAVNSRTLVAPTINWRYGGLKITKIIEDGKQVKEGELLVEFDKAEVLKSIDDSNAELEIALAELRKAQATHQSQIEDLEAEYEKTKLNHRISQLNLEKASFESDIRKKEIELDLEKAAITLEKAKQEIENQKKVNNEEISKLALQVQQVRTKIEEGEETLAKLSMLAPFAGIAIIERSWITREKFQVDDQCWSGMPLIGLPDLSQMNATVQINEVDIAKIDTAQTAYIRMDAYPDSSFKGLVTEISTLARNKERDSNVKVFDATILLEESNPKLMPGMTVNCEIIVNEIPDTFFIPLEALFIKEGKNIVYVKKGNNFEACEVKIGPENDNFVIINEGLKENQQIALIDPTALGTDQETSSDKKEEEK